MTAYVLPWGIPSSKVQVALFSKQLIDGGEDFETFLQLINKDAYEAKIVLSK